MMTQVDINRLIFVALTILGMCLLQRVINYKRQNRARQAVMPVIAIVYDILAIIYLMLHDSDIHKLNQFYQTLTGCDVAIANILLFGGYLILKIICLCVLKKIFQDTERMQKITDLFYVYDEETGNFFLRRRRQIPVTSQRDLPGAVRDLRSRCWRHPGWQERINGPLTISSRQQ